MHWTRRESGAHSGRCNYSGWRRVFAREDLLSPAAGRTWRSVKNVAQALGKFGKRRTLHCSGGFNHFIHLNRLQPKAFSVSFSIEEPVSVLLASTAACRPHQTTEEDREDKATCFGLALKRVSLRVGFAVCTNRKPRDLTNWLLQLALKVTDRRSVHL